MLPESYGRQDVVTSVQNVALLTAAFALGRADLMHLATRDRLHQPYRADLCPLLPTLLPLAGSHGVMSVTLSGAGPAVMLLTGEPAKEGPSDEMLKQAILRLARPLCAVEILPAKLCSEGAVVSVSGER
jgi:homoserine kinase